MKTILALICALFVLLPAGVSAHATPVDMQPHSGAKLEAAPAQISITFSERLETGPSLVRVFDEQGLRVDDGGSLVAEGRTLTTALSAGEGMYTVQWSVVSKDDGHFTRGSYAFSIGDRIAPSSTSEEVVQIATTREAALIFIEFLGNSILWGLLVVFLLVRNSQLRKPFVVLAIVAVCAALIGAGGQLYLKSFELAGLHDTSLYEGFRLYSHTSAGFATLMRALALTIGGVLSAAFGFRNVRTTALMLGIPLLCFAYFRAIISHATANPFYPGLSVVMNGIHVIEKDLWLGVLVVLSVLATLRIRDTCIQPLVPRVFALLSANLALLSVSAGYIVWLHLKDLKNLTGSAWGEVFIPLAVSAAALAAVHSCAVYVGRFRPQGFKKYWSAFVGAETAAALLVVFFSSVVIITSPPPHDSRPAFTKQDGATTISLSRSPYEDSMVLLQVHGSHEQPVVAIGKREGGLQPALEKRFEGGYVFPTALIPSTEQVVYVVVPRTGAYDALAEFNVQSSDFARVAGHGRTFDPFTLFCIVIVVFGVAVASALRIYAGYGTPIDTKRAGVSIVSSLVLTLVVVLSICVAASRLFGNEFKAMCLVDGNMWHIMQPTKAGKPVSGEAREGCMWGMGQYPYQFSDVREYEYLSSLGPAAVAMDTMPKLVRTHAPTKLTFTLKNADGTPATLLVDMEKYVHVVIVSEDQSVFAHIHPDDQRPLTQDEIEHSRFSVEYAFPKAGTYLISLDYAHGTQLESKQFTMLVRGSPQQSAGVQTYPPQGEFDGYTVSMDADSASAEAVATLRFNVLRNGQPVVDMQPYLSAVSHISVVKNDLSAFIHTHGEVHAPGTPYPPVTVKDGKVVHAMESMLAPPAFGPNFEAHVVFPTRGRYTIWAQFQSAHGNVVPARFTLDVE